MKNLPQRSLTVKTVYAILTLTYLLRLAQEVLEIIRAVGNCQCVNLKIKKAEEYRNGEH